MAKANNGFDTPKVKGAKVLEVTVKDSEERDATIARLALGPGPRHATVGISYAASLISPDHTLAIMDSTAVVGDAMARARSGDKAMASDILAA